MQVEPLEQHRWFEKLVGKWSFEADCSMGPDQPETKFAGSESVKTLSGLWYIGEGEGAMPGGGVSRSIMTLGYDPQSQRYVGTFIASMMTHLWVYNGSLDAAKKVLTLDTEGPDWTTGQMANYQDIIEWISDDHRTLSSRMQKTDGSWQKVMTAHYRRVL